MTLTRSFGVTFALDTGQTFFLRFEMFATRNDSEDVFFASHAPKNLVTHTAVSDLVQERRVLPRTNAADLPLFGDRFGPCRVTLSPRPGARHQRRDAPRTAPAEDHVYLVTDEDAREEQRNHARGAYRTPAKVAEVEPNPGDAESSLHGLPPFNVTAFLSLAA